MEQTNLKSFALLQIGFRLLTPLGPNYPIPLFHEDMFHVNVGMKSFIILHLNLHRYWRLSSGRRWFIFLLEKRQNL